jgi:hypothetical protein
MAFAQAVVAFTATGAASQAFTWTPPLSNPTPKVLSCNVISSSPTAGTCGVDMPSAPTNLGGTVRLTCPTTCTVFIQGSD